MDVGQALALGALIVSASALLISSTGARRREVRDRLEDHEERLAKCEQARRDLMKEVMDLKAENYTLYRRLGEKPS